jgi:hypothetical protein
MDIFYYERSASVSTNVDVRSCYGTRVLINAGKLMI